MAELVQFGTPRHERSSSWENGGLVRGIDLFQTGASARVRASGGGQVQYSIRQKPYGEGNPPPRTRGSSG